MENKFDNTPHALEWDDLIAEESGDFIQLDGDFTFTVKSVEKARFPGSAKIPACNKATITLAVDHPDGTAQVKYDLILWSTLEWKISEFLLAIGQKKHGEPTRPNWNAMVGARGKAKFYQRTYTDKKTGEPRTANDVRSFFEYDPSQIGHVQTQPFATAAQASIPYNQTQQSFAMPQGWNRGGF